MTTECSSLKGTSLSLPSRLRKLPLAFLCLHLAEDRRLDLLSLYNSVGLSVPHNAYIPNSFHILWGILMNVRAYISPRIQFYLGLLIEK